METLDELKKQWSQTTSTPGTYDEASLNKIVKSRVRKHMQATMQYFWASFALQILVYGLLCHVIIRYWGDPNIFIPGATGVLLFVPFTIMLMKKFKRMAITSINGTGISSIHEYLSKQRELLMSFFLFKKRYELLLIPLSAGIGVVLTYNVCVPGGATEHILGASITYITTLISCYMVVRIENRKSFVHPIKQLDMILSEYKLS